MTWPRQRLESRRVQTLALKQMLRLRLRLRLVLVLKLKLNSFVICSAVPSLKDHLAIPP